MEQNDKEEQAKIYTQADVASCLAELSRQVVENHIPTLHTMLTLNDLLRLPQAEELFNDELREQARDLWLKVKASGIHLVDPPLLFGDVAEDAVGSDGVDRAVSEDR